MLIHGINDNILINHLYYLGVYQDEEKRDIYKGINNNFMLEPRTQFFDKTLVNVSLSTPEIKNI